nr:MULTISPECIES: methyl-accepting chemotaxis protein [Burkholderiaceae]
MARRGVHCSGCRAGRSALRIDGSCAFRSAWRRTVDGSCRCTSDCGRRSVGRRSSQIKRYIEHDARNELDANAARFDDRWNPAYRRHHCEHDLAHHGGQHRVVQPDRRARGGYRTNVGEHGAACIDRESKCRPRRASTHACNVATNKARDGDRAVADAVERMGSLARRSAQIREITSVIEGIAFQTNLLALNAAVEAARAGAQGRGFAVVAQEVRALAERSSNAAKEIATLINGVTSEVDSSGATVQVAGRIIVELLSSVTGVAELVDAIATASREQSAGIDQINTAVTMMDRMTQQNASLVQDGATTATELEAQTEQLRSAVQAFTV